jgi:histidinol-phosphate/aromatic aminotransferase/cobyric acid decarboxylase-like protein
VPAKQVFRFLLEEHGILVRDVSASPELAECLRISVGTPEDMAATVGALAEILATKK